MWFTRRIRVPKRLIDNYRADLQSAVPLAPKSELSLYELHKKALEDLEELLSREASVEEIAKNVRSQRHTHGWSFLSGDHGARVSSSSDKLFRNVEMQIIKMKGKDWYYSN
jgi:hypothetical protein